MRVPLHPSLRHLPPKKQRALNACIPWRGRVDGQGYPRTKSRGSDGVWRTAYTHRVNYEVAVRKLRPGERLYRLCGDRLCINHLHMTTETPGRPPASAKLTARKVRTIREAWARPDRPTQAVLAKRYRVSRSAISLVVRGITWQDVVLPRATPSEREGLVRDMPPAAGPGPESASGHPASKINRPDPFLALTSLMIRSPKDLEPGR